MICADAEDGYLPHEDFQRTDLSLSPPRSSLSDAPLPLIRLAIRIVHVLRSPAGSFAASSGSSTCEKATHGEIRRYKVNFLGKARHCDILAPRIIRCKLFSVKGSLPFK